MSELIVAGSRPLSRLLKMAVMAGVESAVQIHIDRGDDLNARDANGLTPLMLSAARNKAAICKLLLQAGADNGMLDPSGKTALAIAVAAGASAVIAIFESAIAPIEVLSQASPSAAPPHVDALQPLASLAPDSPIALIGTGPNDQNTASTASAAETNDGAKSGNTQDFDLFDWEPEQDRAPPDADSSVAQAAGAIQAAITVYAPVDSSADWDDIDAYLPERSLPLLRTDDAEARERLRLLLLRATREGSVPLMAVEALSVNDDRSANPEAEALLRRVVNDLGADLDERFEYRSATDNFQVFVKPEATPDEEEIVAGAQAFIEGLGSHRTEPLRIYQQEVQRQRLLSAQGEVALGQAMESGLEAALDALAAWPRGIRLTLAAGRLVSAGHKPLTWMSRGPVEAQPNLEPVLDGDSDAEAAAPAQADDEVDRDSHSKFDARPPPSDPVSDFLTALSQLAKLPVGAVPQGAGWRAIRDALSSLRLHPRFLSNLAHVKDNGDADSCSVARYTSAMTAHQHARERMAVANLKLVFHLAKKYLYSGEPLDDLVQEGNIGLLKAVERYDWRRGFKFSTYATWWIRQQISRYIADKSRTVRLPVHIHDQAQRLYREMQALESETGRAPELDEIAARVDMPADKVAALLRLAPEPLPLHELPIDELIAVDVRSDFVTPDPMDIVSESELHNAIDKVLATLKPREEHILRLRYGIGVHDTLTLEEIGQRYDVTRERIRQIEARAILKLKHPSRMDTLVLARFGGSLSCEGQDEVDGAEPKDAEPATEAKPTQHPAVPKTALPSRARPAPAQSSDLDQLLAQAAELGIPVSDDRKRASGRIWVKLVEKPDNRYRRLARNLLDLGFEFWPGEGYWR